MPHLLSTSWEYALCLNHFHDFPHFLSLSPSSLCLPPPLCLLSLSLSLSILRSLGLGLQHRHLEGTRPAHNTMSVTKMVSHFPSTTYPFSKWRHSSHTLTATILKGTAMFIGLSGMDICIYSLPGVSPCFLKY